MLKQTGGCTLQAAWSAAIQEQQSQELQQQQVQQQQQPGGEGQQPLPHHQVHAQLAPGVNPHHQQQQAPHLQQQLAHQLHEDPSVRPAAPDIA
jgi:hypothetical protein